MTSFLRLRHHHERKLLGLAFLIETFIHLVLVDFFLFLL